MHDISVWLDEGQTRSTYTLRAGSLSTHRLCQVLEERTFALAGTGDSQKIVTQARFW
jgi:hypothetical protein